jgi:hypothetical protein
MEISSCIAFYVGTQTVTAFYIGNAQVWAAGSDMSMDYAIITIINDVVAGVLYNPVMQLSGNQGLGMPEQSITTQLIAETPQQSQADHDGFDMPSVNITTQIS